MSYQEQEISKENQHDDTNYESAASNRLQLSSATFHHPTTVAPFQTTGESMENLIHSKKRQPLSSFQEPSKRATQYHPIPSSDTAANDNPLLGFTKLQLPVSFPNSSPPPLRRTISEPIYSHPASVNAAPPSTQFAGQILNPQAKNVSTISNVEQISKAILRTVSDPTPLANQLGANAQTPPRPTPSTKHIKYPSSGESPNTKRLKRIKERLKEMNLWWNHVMEEGEEEEEEHENPPEFSEEYKIENIQKDDQYETEESEKPSEEAVWVEKNENCLVLHFKCPCGNGYQVLLQGNNCYYKLTDF